MGFEEKDFDREGDYYADDPYGKKPGAHTRDQRRFHHGRPRTLGETSDPMSRPRSHHDHHGPFTGGSTGSYGQQYIPPRQASSGAASSRPRDPSTRLPSVEELSRGPEKEKAWAIRGNKLVGLPPPSKHLKPLSQRSRLQEDGTTSVELTRRSESLRCPIRLPFRMIEGKQFPETKIDYYITPEQLSNTRLPPEAREDCFAGNLTALPVIHDMYEGLEDDDKIIIAEDVIEEACAWRESKLASYQEPPSVSPSQTSYGYPPPPTRSRTVDSQVPYALGNVDMDYSGISRGWTFPNHGMHPPQPRFHRSADGTTTISYDISSNGGYPSGYRAPDPQDYY